MNDDLYGEYDASIGAVMAARKRHDDAILADGEGSAAAQEAQQLLEQRIADRDKVRARYDIGPRKSRHE